MDSLDAIGLKHEVETDARDRGGDKASSGQDYLRDYDELLAPLRHRPVRFLEVGVFQGKSLAVWAEYFSQADIWGADVDLTRFEAKRHTLPSLADPARAPTLRRMDSTDAAAVAAADLPVFDVILDDGLHSGRAQADTFRNLFENHLAPGGIYIVEDTHLNDSFNFFRSFADRVSCFHAPDRGARASKLMGRAAIDAHFAAQQDVAARLVKSVTFMRRRIVLRRGDTRGTPGGTPP